MDEMRLIDIADDLLIINKSTIDALFKLDNCADCIALYVFYYKTAKWQGTNRIKATDDYVKKSLKWGIDKIKKTKDILRENGLITIVQQRDSGKICGWYIEIGYLVSEKKIEDISVKIEDITAKQEPEYSKATSGNAETNASKENNEMLENNKYIYQDSKKASSPKRFVKPTILEIQEFCKEKGYDIDAEYFYNFYESKGWYVGKNKMVSWHSAVANWVKTANARKKTYVQPKRDWNKEMECHNYTEEEINSHITSLSNLDLEDL